MKEFKFACPVCGQHITALSGTSGSQIECPTCFQKIIVPQERTDDSKLILHAAKADRPRAPQTTLRDETRGQTVHRRAAWIPIVVFLVALCGVGAAVYNFRDRLGIGKGTPQPPSSVEPAKVAQKKSAPKIISTNSAWTLNAAEAIIPDEPVTGMLRGEPFAITRATLTGGTLSIRQGKGWPPELAVTIPFPAKHGEDLAGKKVQVEAASQGPVPKISMRWKNETGKPQSKSFQSGYLLMLGFGKFDAGHIPGTIYIALPDDNKSYLAGAFTADVKPPEPPKPKKGKRPAPAKQAPQT